MQKDKDINIENDDTGKKDRSDESKSGAESAKLDGQSAGAESAKLDGQSAGADLDRTADKSGDIPEAETAEEESKNKKSRKKNKKNRNLDLRSKKLTRCAAAAAVSAILAFILSLFPYVNSCTYPLVILSLVFAFIVLFAGKEIFKSSKFTIAIVSVFVCVLSLFFAIMSNSSMLGSFSRFVNTVVGNNVASVEVNITNEKAFGESIEFDDHLKVRIKQGDTFTPSDETTLLTGNYLDADTKNGENYECRKYSVTVWNNTTTNYNTEYFTATLSSGSEDAIRIFDPESKINQNNQVVKSGSKITFNIAFYEKKSSDKVLTVKMSPSQHSYDNVIYSTAKKDK